MLNHDNNKSLKRVSCQLSELIGGKKVLVQLSGGKDSVACLILLAQNGIDVEAIHFSHEYSYDIPDQISASICKKYGIKLTVINITKQLEELFLNGFNLRPCRLCKSIMDRYTVDYAIQNGMDYICVGDTGDDTMLINRIKSAEDDYVISNYFNKRVILPPTLKILRPLIHSSSEEILSFVIQKYPPFRRVNDTGDKYFDYSREGCPLQFKDLGAYYTQDLMIRLKEANTLCSDFATEKGIRASVHLPSGFIVTIPRGYEGECKDYLKQRGIIFPESINSIVSYYDYSLKISLYDDLLNPEVIKFALQRLVERIKIPEPEIRVEDNLFTIRNSSYSGSAVLLMKCKCLVVNLYLDTPIESNSLENIIMEIFHTYKYTINYRVID